MLLVDSEAGLAQLEAALFPSPPAGACAEAAAVGSGAKDGQPRGFGPPGSPYRLVVGLDAEWQPYSSRLGQERTPVSLLQVGGGRRLP